VESLARRLGGFREGDKVEVTDGTCKGFDGPVLQIDESGLKATVEFDVFGRPTPVELLVWQIVKS
jgi:transcription antitermination factor NusG